VAAGKTLGDWVLLPLLCRPEAAPLRALANAQTEALYAGDTSLWKVFIHDSNNYRVRTVFHGGDMEDTTQEAEFDPELLDFVYPYQRETLLPAKVTATQLKGRALDQEISENAAHVPYLRPLSQPKFRQERHGLTPAERGTATHLVLQYLNFSDPDVAGQVERMRTGDLLTDQQAEAVDVKALERFLASPLAQEIRAGANIRREYRFTLLMDARAYAPVSSGEDQILLQGVVDCCFETAEGITVVDFKTDSVWTEPEVTERAERYRPQLEAYSLALEQVLERPVIRRVLYFLRSGRTVEI